MVPMDDIYTHISIPFKSDGHIQWTHPILQLAAEPRSHFSR